VPLADSAAGATSELLLMINELGNGGAEALATFIPKWHTGFACVFKRAVESSRKLTGLIETVAAGRVSTDAAILTRLLGRTSTSSWLAQLSQRELQVLGLMAQGLTNGGIAARLVLELKTVERHINSIYGKLGEQGQATHQRVQAVMAYLAAVRWDPSDMPARVAV
jgi:DNA-binding CsgD family transcriptional regulator